jgi:hypothetical protein
VIHSGEWCFAVLLGPDAKQICYYAESEIMPLIIRSGIIKDGVIIVTYDGSETVRNYAPATRTADLLLEIHVDTALLCYMLYDCMLHAARYALYAL